MNCNFFFSFINVSCTSTLFSENRLLIAHGQIDENVHFKNSELLVSALVKQNKPHKLQPYPTERHGLRHANVAEHFETLMFFWLVNYL